MDSPNPGFLCQIEGCDIGICGVSCNNFKNCFRKTEIAWSLSKGKAELKYLLDFKVAERAQGLFQICFAERLGDYRIRTAVD